MKVKITKALTPKGDNFFYLYADDKFFKAYYFEPSAEPPSISTEERAYLLAKDMADKIEKLSSLDDIEEIVYETPINKESIKM